MECERFILHQLYKNQVSGGDNTGSGGGHWKNSSARLGVNMLLAVFELERGHRNQRKKRKVLEVANLGHSLELGW